MGRVGSVSCWQCFLEKREKHVNTSKMGCLDLGWGIV
ncbi:hypothetical protein V6Z12_A03G046700 [Gossypium hirsutum]